MKQELDRPMSLSYVMTTPIYRADENDENHSSNKTRKETYHARQYRHQPYHRHLQQNYHKHNNCPVTPDLSPLEQTIITPSSPQSTVSSSGSLSSSASSSDFANSHQLPLCTPSYQQYQPPSSAGSSSSISPPSSLPSYHQSQQLQKIISIASDEDGEDYDSVNGLSLLERRQRNKTASAKYRQKKNKQQVEMKQMLDALTEQDALLKRQMMELRLENERLKSMNDHLRGKLLARKMLDQYFGRHRDHHHPHHHPVNAATPSLSSPPSSSSLNTQHTCSSELRNDPNCKACMDHADDDFGSIDSF